MKEQVYTLTSPEVVGNCLSAIVQAPLDGTTQVHIGRVKEKRRTAQNNTYWMWLEDLEKQQGDSREVWHDRLRRGYLSEIYLSDPQNRVQNEWVEAYNRILQLMDDASAEQRIEAEIKISGLVSTTWATVEQFTEYLGAIQRWCVHNGYNLRYPDDYHIAMGQKTHLHAK